MMLLKCAAVSRKEAVIFMQTSKLNFEEYCKHLTTEHYS